MSTEALCTVCLAHMGRTSEALRATIVRWLMAEQGYISQHEMTDEELIASTAPRIRTLRVKASEIMALFVAEARRHKQDEPPF